MGLKDYIGRIYFYPTTHMMFPGGSVTPVRRRPYVWPIDSEFKTKNCYIALQVYFKHLKNSKFFAGSSSVS